MSPDFFYYGTSVSGCPDFDLPGSLSSGIDAMTKSFYSLVLSDLGQAVPTNLLTSPEAHYGTAGNDPSARCLRGS